MTDKPAAIKKINKLINAEIRKGCKACNELGVYHCGFPEECGNWTELERLEKLKTKIK